jgi:hypothetical protein
MTYRDDRTKEERITHPVIVLGTDSFMSGWGECRGGTSYAGWACRVEDLDRVERWVRARSEMLRVRIVGGEYRPGNLPGDCHVYVVNDGHASLS